MRNRKEGDFTHWAKFVLNTGEKSMRSTNKEALCPRAAVLLLGSRAWSGTRKHSRKRGARV